MVNPDACSELRRRRRPLAICCVMSCTGAIPLVTQPFSLYRQSWRVEFGWTNGQISLAISILVMLLAFGVLFAGFLADRYPIRNVLRCYAALYTLAILSVALCRGSLLHFYTSFAALGLSAAGVSQFIYSKLLAQWFVVRLGTALACLTSCIALSAIATPLITHKVLTAFGWRTCWLLWCGVACSILFPFGSLLPDDREKPDRRELRQARRDYLCSLEFWSLASLFVFLGLGVSACHSHLGPLIAEVGVTPAAIAACISLFGAGNLIGRFAAGWLLDRWPALHVIYLTIASSALALALFLLSRPAFAGLACLLLGFSGGAELDLLPYLVRRSFGVARMAEIAGSVFMPHLIVSSGVVAATGYSRDAYGSFTPMLLVCLVSSIPATAAAILWDGQNRRSKQAVQGVTPGD